MQYVDNVINNGTSDYANAFFEIGSVRAYSLNFTAAPDTPDTPSGSAPLSPPVVVKTTAGPDGAPITVTQTLSSPTGKASGAPGGAQGTNGASWLSPSGVTPVMGALSLFAWLML